MPAWLRQAHQKLDDAVSGAYGWPASHSDDEILSRPRDLDLRTAAASTNESLDVAHDCREPHGRRSYGYLPPLLVVAAVFLA
jgi:hypothetical protein